MVLICHQMISCLDARASTHHKGNGLKHRDWQADSYLCKGSLQHSGKKWYRDYFTEMIVRQKWHIQQRNFQAGDIVIVQEDNPARATWRMAEISKIEPSSDGLVRDVTLRYKPLTSGSEYNGRPDIFIKRSTHRLKLIIETDERTPEPQRDPSVTPGPQHDLSMTMGPQRGGSVSSD